MECIGSTDGDCPCSVFYFYGECGHSRGELPPWKPPRPPKPPRASMRRSVVVQKKESPEDEALKKRAQVVEEVVTSENTYFSRLQGAWDVYIDPLKELHILGEEDISNIFYMWEALLGIHKRLSEELTNGFKNHALDVGKVFNTYSHYFKMYQPYLNNYSRACDRRGELLTSDRKFSEFCQERRRDPRCQKQSLMDLMIEPVQRIPRYQLLLERVLKYTPEDHSERTNLVSAFARIKEVAVTNNEALAKSEELREDQDKILEVMMSFTWNTRMNLLDDPSRKLLLEGPMMRQTRRTVKEFQFWLFTDKLLYGEAFPGTEGVFTLHRVLDLSNCHAAIPPPRHTCDDIECAIYIESAQKSFIVWAPTVEEKSEWLSSLKQAIENCERQMSEHTEKAPMWTPNTATDSCECCGKEFSMMVFRHHCRKCGDVVCAECSNNSIVLPNVDSKKESRVCDRCFDTFIEDSTEFANVEQYFEKKAATRRRSTIFGSMKSLVGSGKGGTGSGSDSPSSRSGSFTLGGSSRGSFTSEKRPSLLDSDDTIMEGALEDLLNEENSGGEED